MSFLPFPLEKAGDGRSCRSLLASYPSYKSISSDPNSPSKSHHYSKLESLGLSALQAFSHLSVLGSIDGSQEQAAGLVWASWPPEPDPAPPPRISPSGFVNHFDNQWGTCSQCTHVGQDLERKQLQQVLKQSRAG